jgi:hypothetical protein
VPEVEALLTACEKGTVKPLPVQLPPLPKSRSPAVRQVAGFFCKVYGLRLYAGDERWVPFACQWVADKLGIPKLTVWRALVALVEAGTLVRPPERSLPGRGGRRGTDLYLPGPVPDDHGSRTEHDLGGQTLVDRPVCEFGAEEIEP